MTEREPTRIPHVIKGRTVTGDEVSHEVGGQRFTTPALDVDALVWSRTEPLPAADVPLQEVIELLEATGDMLAKDPDGLLAEALAGQAATSPYDQRILKNSYADLQEAFRPETLLSKIDAELGGTDVSDGWVRRATRDGRVGEIRAYPTRIAHILAGNAPGVAVNSIVNGALSKGVHLLKMPSNDLLTASAVLRTMTTVAPAHPTVASFSAVYWRGGDPAVENPILRAQFFDKLAVWGGEGAVRNALRYAGPGLELISFDPKNSISMIGREVFATPAQVAAVAERGACDSVYYNQETCTTSRFHFVEGDIAQVDTYCEQLRQAMRVERRYTSTTVPPLPADVREEIDTLRLLEPDYHVFGDTDGTGLVVRSSEPVDFQPSQKTVNVVAVDDLTDALRYVNVATQTVGVWPAARRRALRDPLAAAGAQRIVALGSVSAGMLPGFPHDGFYPLHRFVRWMSDEAQR